MHLYVETSAALQDLLDGEAAAEIRSALKSSTLLFTSRLTLAEVGRVLARTRVLEPELAGRLAAREAAWFGETERWVVHPVSDDILARGAMPWPAEPVRTLDGIHLATIETLSSVVSDLVVVTTDLRIRHNCVALRHPVLP